MGFVFLSSMRSLIEKAFKTKLLQQQQRKPVSDSQISHQLDDSHNTDDNNSHGLESAPTVTEQFDRLISTESDNPKKNQKHKKVSNY